MHLRLAGSSTSTCQFFETTVTCRSPPNTCANSLRVWTRSAWNLDSQQSTFPVRRVLAAPWKSWIGPSMLWIALFGEAKSLQSCNRSKDKWHSHRPASLPAPVAQTTTSPAETSVTWHSVTHPSSECFCGRIPESVRAGMRTTSDSGWCVLVHAAPEWYPMGTRPPVRPANNRTLPGSDA